MQQHVEGQEGKVVLRELNLSAVVNCRKGLKNLPLARKRLRRNLFSYLALEYIAAGKVGDGRTTAVISDDSIERALEKCELFEGNCRSHK